MSEPAKFSELAIGERFNWADERPQFNAANGPFTKISLKRWEDAHKTVRAPAESLSARVVRVSSPLVPLPGQRSLFDAEVPS